MNTPRILFIDAYDSFSNNIVSLLTTTLDAHVDIVPIDPPELNPSEPEFSQRLINLLRRYDAVVCGPGPGSPDLGQDVGLMKYIWELEPEHLVPVLGICLGFQSLVVSCGGIVKKLKTGIHGMIREIDHAIDRPNLQGSNIFYGVEPFKATLYHSLHADIGQDSISADNWAMSRWSSPVHLPDVVPLAWVYENRDDCVERILMSMRHRTKPFWGLQYHPESICTEPTGHQVIKNWFGEAVRWNQTNNRIRDPVIPSPGATTELHNPHTHNLGEGINPLEPGLNSYRSWANSNSELSSFGINHRYSSKTLRLPIHIEAPDIVEILQSGKKDFIILDSASAKANRIGADVRGRYSIVALDVDEALKLEYRTGDRYVTIRGPTSQGSHEVLEKVQLGARQTIWQLLAEFWTSRRITAGDHSTPFLGGFMGYTTYELGLEGIDVSSHQERRHGRPDLCFAWVTKSVVIDHTEGIIRLQYLSPSEPEAKGWVDSVAEKLSTSPVWSDGLQVDFNKRAQLSQLTPPSTPKSTFTKASIQVPDADEYEAKVRTCQDYIASGDSYELCLTDQTHITRPRSPAKTESSLAPLEPGIPPQTSWQLYRSLRSRQPAPFGSYIRLGGATLISSSPERFLEYSADGLCSMRPMKGTVRKSRAVSTLAQAEAILHVPKEEAENLMIVDLVRHDLHGVCGPGSVAVPKLNIVEEYASVFQMISVVEGNLPRDGSKSGLDVLAASLPPGSMTGAPKKRSCEILNAVERRRDRSLYSGLVGYMDAAGRGDWSVTIRSLFRWDDERLHAGPNQDLEVWHIGAGGAVTALSTAEGERDEMFTKLKGPLGVFDDEA
ncbi:para-aminobenzoate synthase [Jackrogersella minutella]|nr:para-aminobenzoate synthase [Jackrogersella minutella]